MQAAAHGNAVAVGKFLREQFRLRAAASEGYDPERVWLRVHAYAGYLFQPAYEGTRHTLYIGDVFLHVRF